jgi:hypothetical protein
VETLWPWLAAAGLGALHGLNPASGWAFVAACGLRAGDRTQAPKALASVAAGHAAAVSLVGVAVAMGLSMDRRLVQGAAAALLVAVVASIAMRRRRCQPGHPGWRPAGRVALALWSFVVSTGHGAGTMLVPALMPLCAGSPAGTASGSMAAALAAVGIHMGAMLVASGTAAALACRVARRTVTKPH